MKHPVYEGAYHCIVGRISGEKEGEGELKDANEAILFSESLMWGRPQRRSMCFPNFPESKVHFWLVRTSNQP